MAFKRIRDASVGTTTIESLFQDLRGRRVDSPWGHQVDLWRTYEQHAPQSADVAIQLPTGSGKTLVGLVLAEWRRRKFQERVVYLCPTRQLANQVATQAREQYGLDVALLVGRKDDFDRGLSGDYLAAQRIAVSTYSGLFNVNPFFSDPHVVICDDAHAAEQYVAKHWSLEISTEDHPALHIAVASILNRFLEPHAQARLSGDARADIDLSWCDKLPSPQWFDVEAEVSSVIDTHVADTKLRFAWNQIRPHLQACHLYMGHGRILIRPFIPPTETHAPFAGARQRVYMSATLGEGGELERIFGRRRIKRLEIPQGWNKQGLGRRFYFFPERALDEDDATNLSIEMMQEAGRSVVLVPNDRSARAVTELVTRSLHLPVFQARDLEVSKHPFLAAGHAVVVAANRYEGIDFPGDESHLLIVMGLPRATHLQERFLLDRMGASAMFNERILTRVIQAFGRCTRSATDYSAVVVQGEELYRYLMRSETRAPLDPEMQAELEFGILQSDGVDAVGAIQNLRTFLEQGDAWKEVDKDILSLRAKKTQTPFPGIDELQASVLHEVDYTYAVWSGDLEGARDACDRVLALLKNPAVSGYKAWWSYVAGAVCWSAVRKGGARFEVPARRYFRSAAHEARFVSWLSDLTVKYGEPDDRNGRPTPPEVARMLERIEERFLALGTANMRRFSMEEKTILEGLNGDAPQFEEAQRRLGLLLGFVAGNSDEQGAPDPWWQLDNTKCLVFEDHSDAKPGSSLDGKKARQAALHPNWLREKKLVPDDCEVRSVLVSPVTRADGAARPHLGDFAIWPLQEFQEWARTAVAALRRLRRDFNDRGDLAWRAQAAAALEDSGLLPSDVWKTATARRGAEVLTS